MNGWCMKNDSMYIFLKGPFNDYDSYIFHFLNPIFTTKVLCKDFAIQTANFIFDVILYETKSSSLVDDFFFFLVHLFLVQDGSI